MQLQCIDWCRTVGAAFGSKGSAFMASAEGILHGLARALGNDFFIGSASVYFCVGESLARREGKCKTSDL